MLDVNAPSVSACTRLKEATAGPHRELEAQPVLARLMSDDVSEETYGRVLQAFAAYHAGWEPAVFDALAQHVDASFLDPRRKRRLLERDLAGLNLRLPVADRQEILDLGEAIGRFYVQEGATLGGVVIKKHLSRALPEHARWHTAFFAGYGSDTARMWARSSDEINRLCSEQAVLADAVAGARAAFLSMKTCLRSAWDLS